MKTQVKICMEIEDDFCSVRAKYILTTGPRDIFRHDLLNQNLRKQKFFRIKQTELNFSSYLLPLSVFLVAIRNLKALMLWVSVSSFFSGAVFLTQIIFVQSSQGYFWAEIAVLKLTYIHFFSTASHAFVTTELMQSELC